MDINIKKIVTNLVQKISGDNNLIEKFKKDPIGTVKGLLGSIDLNNEQLSGIVEAVKAKLNLDSVAGIVGGLFGGKKG